MQSQPTHTLRHRRPGDDQHADRRPLHKERRSARFRCPAHTSREPAGRTLRRARHHLCGPATGSAALKRDPTCEPIVGDQLPVLVRGPISRGALALFAGASNDHFFIHTDSDYAKSAGLPDVIASGMLIMAYLGHLLTSLIRQEQSVHGRSVSSRWRMSMPSSAVRERFGRSPFRTANVARRSRSSRAGLEQIVLVGDAVIRLDPA